MAAVPTLPTLGADATLEDIRNQLAIIQKTMTFMLTSNLGSSNAYEFGNWLVTDDSLISENGTVGFSTAVTSGDDIRIWAGDETNAIAPFRVYESGHVYASNLTMVGGSIDWGSVVKPVYTPGEVGAIAANQDAVFDVLTNYGESQGLFIDRANNQLYINAQYINTGIMTAIQYRTAKPEDHVPRIEMYQNQLNSYNDLGQLDGIQLGMQVPGEISFAHTMGNISFYSNGYRALAITDEVVTGYSIGPRNGYSMALGWSSSDTIYARGNWIFSGTTDGIIAQFG